MDLEAETLGPSYDVSTNYKTQMKSLNIPEFQFPLLYIGNNNDFAYLRESW